jgi:hypothetical protein
MVENFVPRQRGLSEVNNQLWEKSARLDLGC